MYVDAKEADELSRVIIDNILPSQDQLPGQERSDYLVKRVLTSCDRPVGSNDESSNAAKTAAPLRYPCVVGWNVERPCVSTAHTTRVSRGWVDRARLGFQSGSTVHTPPHASPRSHDELPR